MGSQAFDRYSQGLIKYRTLFLSLRRLPLAFELSSLFPVLSFSVYRGYSKLFCFPLSSPSSRVCKESISTFLLSIVVVSACVRDRAGATQERVKFRARTFFTFCFLVFLNT